MVLFDDKFFLFKFWLILNVSEISLNLFVFGEVTIFPLLTSMKSVLFSSTIEEIISSIIKSRKDKSEKISSSSKERLILFSFELILS